MINIPFFEHIYYKDRQLICDKGTGKALPFPTKEANILG